MSEPVTLEDHERLARECLDPGAWAYLCGGAADEITLRDNRTAWQRLQLRPRVLRPLAGGHTRSELFGRELAHPMLVAPMAYQRLAHRQGELASAMAASVMGLGYVLSTQSSVSLEAVAHLAHKEPASGPLWFQLYLQPDRGLTQSLVARAEAAGYEALVLTVDAPVQGSRDQESRAGFQLPPGVAAVNLPDGVAMAAGGLACAVAWPSTPRAGRTWPGCNRSQGCPSCSKASPTRTTPVWPSSTALPA